MNYEPKVFFGTEKIIKIRVNPCNPWTKFLIRVNSWTKFLIRVNSWTKFLIRVNSC